MTKSTATLVVVAAVALSLFGTPTATLAQSAQAKVIKKVAPEFPAEADRKRINDGVVKARLTIGGDGGVTEVTVTSVTPLEARVFSASAVEALTKWRFEPAGKQQSMDITLVFQRE